MAARVRQWLTILAAVVTLVVVPPLTLLTLSARGFVGRRLASDPNSAAGGNLSRESVDRQDQPLNGLFWFVHVSDLHISMYRDPDRGRDLGRFCAWVKDVVEAPVVVVTGDLTDAKNAYRISSRQNQEEWVEYWNILDACGILKASRVRQATRAGTAKSPPAWLDIRGNHDTFDVSGENATNNYFDRYSVQGGIRGRRRSYFEVVESRGQVYAFVGIDATLVPGPKRPFNFFGTLVPSQMEELRLMLEAANRHQTGGLITFGHYPASSVVAPGWGGGLAQVLGRAGPAAHLSGHLHSLLGLVPRMHARQEYGYLDLEVSDWKELRSFRILALDHGHLSFIDSTFPRQEHPSSNAVVLITNPLDARYVYGHGPKIRDALGSMQRSTHVRVLVFTSATVTSVTASVDNDDDKRLFSAAAKNHSDVDCQRVEVGSSLFACPWAPEELLPRADRTPHTLTVTVRLEDAQSHPPVVVSRQFCLDMECLLKLDEDETGGPLQTAFPTLARLALMNHLSTTGAILVFYELVLIVAVLLLLRRNGKHPAPRVQSPPREAMGSAGLSLWKRTTRFQLFSEVFSGLYRKFWLLANINELFYPLVLAACYVALGPWGVGFYLSDRVGVLFMWGMFIDGVLLPVYTTIFYAGVTIFPQLVFLCVCLAFAVDRRFQRFRTAKWLESGSKHKDTDSRCAAICRYLWRNLWFWALMLFQVLMAMEMWNAYGWIATLSVPGALRILFCYTLWSRANSIPFERLPKDCFKRWPMVDDITSK